MRISYQLRLGKKIEREHLGTIRKLKTYRYKVGKCMPDNKIIENIAKDHLPKGKVWYQKNDDRSLGQKTLGTKKLYKKESEDIEKYKFSHRLHFGRNPTKQEKEEMLEDIK